MSPLYKLEGLEFGPFPIFVGQTHGVTRGERSLSQHEVSQVSQNRVGPQLVVGFNSWFCLEHVVPKNPLAYKRGHRQSHPPQHQSSHSCLSEVFATDETNIVDIHSAVS